MDIILVHKERSFFFDVTSNLTYSSLEKWHRNVVRVAENIPMVIVGSKCDLTENRQVPPGNVTFHVQKNLHYCEISAKEETNLFGPLIYLAQKLMEKPDLTSQNGPNRAIPITETTSNPKKANAAPPQGKAKKIKEPNVPQPEAKKAKDPNAPKRSKSAYIFFTDNERENVRRVNPEMKMTDISKKLGEMWKGLSDQDKKKYEDMAAQDKQRYETEKAQYLDSGGSISTTSKKAKKDKKAKKIKDPNAPKRSKSAYMFFTQVERENVRRANPEMKMTDISKKLGEMWKGLSDQDKKKYEDMAAQDKQRYETEKAQYLASGGNVSTAASAEIQIRISKKGKATKKAATIAKPKAVTKKTPAKNFIVRDEEDEEEEAKEEEEENWGPKKSAKPKVAKAKAATTAKPKKILATKKGIAAPKKVATTKKKVGSEDDEGSESENSEGSEEENFSKKKIKSNIPRPKSAYLFFCEDQRLVIKQQNPNMNIVECAKMMGEMWKSIGSEEKKKYEQMAQQDKERYEQAMKK